MSEETKGGLSVSIITLGILTAIIIALFISLSNAHSFGAFSFSFQGSITPLNTNLLTVGTLILCLIGGALYRKVQASSEVLVFLSTIIGLTTFFSGSHITFQTVAAIVGTPILREQLKPYVPSWWLPMHELDNFMQGGIAVPWGEWAGCLFLMIGMSIAWGILMISVATILRRHYIDIEGLLFPTSVMYSELINLSVISEGEEKPPIFSFKGRSKLLWIGFLLGILTYICFLISFFIPTFPTWDQYILFVDDRTTVAHAYIPGIIFAFTLWPGQIAFATLLPLDQAFSIWFSSILLWMIIAPILVISGVAPYDPSWNWSASWGNIGKIIGAQEWGLGYGILLGLAIIPMVLHFDYYKATLKKGIPEEEEALPYKYSYILLIFSFLVFLSFFLASGADPLASFIFVILNIIGSIGIMRLLAENTWGAPPVTLSTLLSTETLKMRAIAGTPSYAFTALAWNWQAYEKCYANPGAFSLFMYRVAKNSRAHPRTVFIASLISIVVSALVAYPVTLWAAYTWGMGRRLGAGWVFNLWAGWCGDACNANTVGTPPTYLGIFYQYPMDRCAIHIAIGFIVTLVLMFLRMRFVWWPWTPAGLLIASIHWGTFTWSAVLIGWVIKYIVIKIGGAKAYENYLIPIVTGWATGGFLISFINGVLSLLRTLGYPI